jgi:NAD-dependent dihydropyrimidine dehydrogenase PreA subunit
VSWIVQKASFVHECLGTCGYDKLQGIHKQPMFVILVQNITKNNQGQNWNNCLTNNPCFWIRQTILQCYKLAIGA